MSMPKPTGSPRRNGGSIAYSDLPDLAGAESLQMDAADQLEPRDLLHLLLGEQADDGRGVGQPDVHPCVDLAVVARQVEKFADREPEFVDLLSPEFLGDVLVLVVVRFAVLIDAGHEPGGDEEGRSGDVQARRGCCDGSRRMTVPP